MTNAKKKKGVKTLRKPPAETGVEEWIKGASENNPGAQELKHSGTQAPNNPKTQVTDNSATQDTKKTKPSGTGILERADGTYRRRLVVYIDPDHATQLKVHAALDHRDMSEIVDELVGQWVASKNS